VAESQAALLSAPEIEVHGGRFPENSTLARPARAGDDYQVRAALSLSLLDVYRGRRVLRAGESECAHYEADRRLEQILVLDTDFGRLPALRRAASFLEERRGSWQAVERRTDAALAARVISLPEALEQRDRSARLERRRAELSGEIARLTALGASSASEVDLAKLLSAAHEAAMEYERDTSHLRTLDAWELRVVAGAVPDAPSTDYFGVVEFSFDLGAYAQRAAERRALAARDEELRTSRSELRHRLRVFREVAAANRSEAERAASIVAERLAALRVASASLDGAQASRAAFTRDALELELISAEAERIFFGAWLAELRRLEAPSDAG
jgi:hypothetical protein